jgi:ribonuclease BN (tRNA processing enzyme)
VQLQVLGSGGPALSDGRAASGFLVWVAGHARLLVDAGSGVALRFSQSGARFEDLDAIVLTDLRAGHSADLTALLEASRLSARRTAPLPLYGPRGNRHMPSTVAFARALFDDTRGAYRYLGDLLSPISRESYKLKPMDVRPPPNPPIGALRHPAGPLLDVFANERLEVTAAIVPQDNTPALAYRVAAAGRSVVFMGDTSGETAALAALAKDADLLVASHAIAETAGQALRARYMVPSAIGRLAQAAGVRQLVLAHRTPATLGREADSLGAIRAHYAGPVAFADDLACFTP